MYVSWLGQSCLKIQTKHKDQNIVIITDPFDPSAGIKLSRLQADIVLYSNETDDPKRKVNISGEPFVIDSAGEFEVKGVFVYGLATKHKDGPARLYMIELEGMSLAFLGNLDHALSEEELKILEDADVVFVPSGGGDALDGVKAVEAVNQIEPRLVIPIRYKTKGLTKKYNDEKKFCNEVGVSCESEEKLKIVKKELPQEEKKVVILTR